MNNLNEQDELLQLYEKKDHIDHIKDLPDTYIGSVQIEKCNKYIINTDISRNDNDEITNSLSIISKEIEYSPGFENINDEIMVNCFDNRNRVLQRFNTNNKLLKVTQIRVNVDKETNMISMMNNGERIDVALHPKEKIYIPQMIFGELLTSGNYNKSEEKITGGKNGYGAKLTNIFSKYFKIETVDKKRKLYYSQEYEDNMSIKHEPIIKKYTKEPFTRITYYNYH